MKKLTTILCSLAFMVSGIMMALHIDPKAPSIGHGLSAEASPVFIPVFDKTAMPLDLQLGIKGDNPDTVYVTKHDTVQVVTTKWRKAPAPKPVIQVRTDTVYYLATQVGNKEGPSEEGGAIYEVHKVDNINPVNTTPGVQHVTEEPCCTCTPDEHIE